MFSKACEYAIKSIIYIESKNDEFKKTSLTEIAEAIDSPVAFTAKILQQLKKNGLLISTMGAQGGFQINKNRPVKMLDVVLAIDGDALLTKCILGLKVCSSSNPCPFHETNVRIRQILQNDMLNFKIEDFSDLINSKIISLR
jgi:Rrf2 family protein